MAYVLQWLVVIELLGLVAFPVLFKLLPFLPDRGYSIAKMFGLLMVSWPMWILGSVHFVPTNTLSLWALVLSLSSVSLVYAYINRRLIGEFLQGQRHFVFICEGLFILLYLAWIFYRSYDPSINTTEKPMDFAFLNASVMASFFPPEDPWLRGHDIGYYYFGYLMMANLSELSMIPTQISYNLALSVMPALAGSAVFGLVYNLIRLHGASVTRSTVFSMVAPVLLVGVSNLVGILEFIRIRGWGSVAAWEWLGIKDVDLGGVWGFLGPAEHLSWRPQDYMWWWRSSRVIDSFDSSGASLDYTITEFPFFSFLLGDLHPHVMSIPFILLFLGFCLNFCIASYDPQSKFKPIDLKTLVLGSWLLGTLAFVNSWDVIPFSLLWVILIIFRFVHQSTGRLLPTIWRVSRYVVCALSLAFIMYLPYYLGAESQASGILPVGTLGTRPIHLFIVWGLFLLLLTPFIFRQLPQLLPVNMSRQPISDPVVDYAGPVFSDGRSLSLSASQYWPRVSIVAGILLVPFFVWLSWQLWWSTLIWSSGPLVGVLERFVNLVPLMVLIFAAIYTVIRYGESGKSPVITFVFATISVGLLLILAPEYLRVDDLFHNRMNTIFKFYYESWILLAIASAFSLYFLLSAGFPRTSISRIGMGVWSGVVAIVLAGSLYYPVEAAFTKSGQFSGPVTLDGLNYVHRYSPDEYSAIIWLKKNGKVGEGILEAAGQEWNPNYSRMSGSTGLSTVLGWPGHEHQWRGSTEPLQGRAEDIATVYSTQDPSLAKLILSKYDISYVVISPQEKASYPNLSEDKFLEIGDLVFSREKARIYRVSY